MFDLDKKDVGEFLLNWACLLHVSRKEKKMFEFEKPSVETKASITVQLDGGCVKKLSQ